jgi:hypothetical protein
MAQVSTDRRRGINSSAAIKVACITASTANLTLSGEQTVDGIALVDGDRVLAKNQTDTTENGIYVVSTGAWSRAVDFDGSFDVVEGTLIPISRGTINGDTMWRVTNTGVITIGTTSLTFEAAVFAESSSLAYTPAGAGAVSTTVQAKLRETFSVLDFGADSTGVTDSTTEIQSAITAAAGGILFWPEGTYLVDAADGDAADRPVLTIPSNSCFIFSPNVKVNLNTTTSGRYKIFHIKDVSNVVIHGNKLLITGDRAGPIGSTYENGHGVNIEGSDNVVINDVDVVDCWGDGFYVGAGSGGFSENIVFNNNSSSNNYRQGLSIISCKNFDDYNGRYDNTTGTTPACGVDVEPDSTTQFLQGIRFHGTSAKGNDGGGIFIFLANLDSTSAPVDINLISCRSEDNSNDTASHGIYAGFEVRRVIDVGQSPPLGVINFIDCMSNDDQYGGISITDKSADGARVRIINPVVLNPNQSTATTSINQSNGIIVKSTGVTYTTNPGGVDIINPLVNDDDVNLNNASLALIAYQSASASSRINDVLLTTPRLIGTGPDINGSTDSDGLKFSLVEKTEIDAGGNLSVFTPRHSLDIVTNSGQVGGTWTMALPSSSQVGIGDELEFLCRAAQTFRIDPNGTDNFLPGGGAGKYYESSTIGSRLRIKRDSASTWQILDETGTWAFEP